MTKRSLKATNIDYQGNTGEIQNTAQKPTNSGKSWLWSTLSIMVLLGCIGSIVTLAWISLLFIFNPEQVVWLNEILPQWARIPQNQSDRPQTIKEIQQSLSQQKRLPGETLVVGDPAEKMFLQPVFQKRTNCQSNCQALVELRIYQQSKELNFLSQPEKHYRLITKLSIKGTDESFVKAPYGQSKSESENPDTTTYLPLTEVKAFEDSPPSTGFWFYLRGEWEQGDRTLSYGNIVHYNLQANSLRQMLSWKSPRENLPKWEQITGTQEKELVVDYTVDLEPHLQAYVVKSNSLFPNSLELEPINLASPAIEDSSYPKALLLARNGLWTPAFEWLTSIKKQRKTPMPASAQAQIDLIRLHSEFTKIQAEKNWASPSQQVLTYLIDGSWEKALDVFMASPNNALEISSLLKADKGRLWNRSSVALRLNPTRKAVLGWVTLMFAVQRGEERANAWLQQQTNIDGDTITYIQDLLAQLNTALTKNQVFDSHPSRIVGAVQQLSNINYNQWLPIDPKSDLIITSNQVWYQVEVSAFNNGTSWVNYPFTDLNPPNANPGKFFGDILGITVDPTIQIIVWGANGEQQINIATIKAVQLQGGFLRLLVAGSAISEAPDTSVQPRPLALTTSALEWVQPSPISLQELYQKNPGRMDSIVASIWRVLQVSGDILPGDVPKFAEIEEKIGIWPVQLLDFNQNGQPEIVLTISAGAISGLNQGEPQSVKPTRTLILSDQGKVIYTDFTANS
ncbi:hypothetical protein VB711_19825, partial [Cronbergia sp. UHCC 0137]|uniref:hypothetical protein n=1 Tax=Cronbergia sp. UHCC 0137 TaxID=3110239 RepID=UPI002B205541